ncbi:MAG: hypothetical protein KC431_15805 [Myxococcales bacterium]|nr:hypothetical protein [Myxococcales bacterium]
MLGYRYMRSAALLALSLAACKTEPAPKPDPEPSDSSATKTDEDRAALVTLELAWVGDEQARQLRERMVPGAPAEGAALLAVRHRVVAPWHIYWRNPGDSGLRTRLDLELPPHLQAGEVLYPAPDHFVSEGGQHSYGWGEEVVLFVPVDAKGEGTVTVHSRWLACHESCIPGDGSASIELPAPGPIADDDALAPMLARLPEPAGERVAAEWLTGPILQLRAAAGTLGEFFPYESDAPLLREQKLDEQGQLQLHYRIPTGADLPPAQGLVAWTDGPQTRWIEIAAPWP